VQDLDGDLDLEAEVLAGVDGPHPSFVEHLRDPIRVLEHPVEEGVVGSRGRGDGSLPVGTGKPAGYPPFCIEMLVLGPDRGNHGPDGV
jgi:hypothetical protein